MDVAGDLGRRVDDAVDESELLDLWGEIQRELDKRDRNSPDSAALMEVLRRVPLRMASLVEFSPGVGEALGALETAVATVRSGLVEAARASGAIPDDVNVQLSGASDALDATRSALTGNFVVAVLLCYLLLVAIFSHWGYPFLIMTTVPLGIGGGIVGLWLLNAAGQALPKLGLPPFSQAFDMITMLGFLILVGTVVNNPILIVDRAIRNLREEAMDARDAVRDAVASRLRPIAMSTITTVCGLSPLVLIPGAGTELYRGVGAIVMFGIIGAALVTLTMLPALTVAVLSLRRKAAS